VAANTLQASYTDLQGEVARALNWHLTVGSWTSTNTSDFSKINRDALRQVYFPEPLDGERSPHVWSWLRPKGTLDLNGAYATGTITVAADASGSIATLASGTWPSWAASGDLWVSGEKYAVSSRTSDSIIRLVNVSVTVAAGTSYSLKQHEYDLPEDFGGMNSDGFVVRRDQNECGFIPLWTPGDLQKADRDNTGEGLPSRASIVPVVPTATDDSRWQVQFADPMPREDLRLEYYYKAIPPVLNGTTYVYHHGGAPMSRMVIASYIDMAYQKVRDSFEKRDAFRAALRQAVMYDRQANPAHSFGRGVRSIGGGSRDSRAYVRSRWAQQSYDLSDIA
jgi:hypothetical protein